MSLIKIQSQQQGPFTDQFNNCDFTIQEGVYNTEKSYINFICNVSVAAGAFNDTATTANTKNTDSIVNVGLVHNVADKDRQELFNVSLVKHCRLETSNYGNVLNHRYINVLSNNLKYYEMSKGEIRSMNFQRAGLCFADNKSDPVSQFVNKTKNGTNDSVILRDVSLKVPLKDLRGVMENGVLPVDKLGRSTLHLELQPSIFKAVDLAQFNNFWTVKSWTAGATALQVQPYIPITPTFATTTNYSIEDVLNNHPFYVGMSFRVNNGAAGGGNFYKVRVIGVSLDNTSNLINLTLFQPAGNSPLPTNGGAYTLTYNDLMVVGDANLSYTLDRAELVLEKLDVPTSNMKSLVYREFKTQENNGYTSQNFNDTYILEPECVNTIFTMHDDPNKLLSNPIPETTLDNYRMSVNNVDILKRPISVVDRLQADRMSVLFANMDLTLKSHFPYFNTFLLNSTAPSIQQNAQSEVLIIGSPVPLTDSEKLLNIQINSRTNPAISKLYLFKQLVKVIEL